MTIAGSSRLHPRASHVGFGFSDLITVLSIACSFGLCPNSRNKATLQDCADARMPLVTGQASETGMLPVNGFVSRPFLGHLAGTSRLQSAIPPGAVLSLPSATRSVLIPRPAALGVLLRNRLRPPGLGIQQETSRTECVRLRPRRWATFPAGASTERHAFGTWERGTHPSLRAGCPE